jgi:hypothetical protein
MGVARPQIFILAKLSLILTTVARMNRAWTITDKRHSQESEAQSRKASVTGKVTWLNYSPTTFHPL